MKIGSRVETAMLLAGDVFFFFLALWATLLVRHFEVPPFSLLLLHAAPFSIIFLIWVVIFFIADLYKKQTLFVAQKLPRTLVNAQVANSVIAVTFFYLIPYFGITPKTILFVDLVFSLVFIVLWRLYLVDAIYAGKRGTVVIVGASDEAKRLYEEILNNPRHRLNVEKIEHIAKDTFQKFVSAHNISAVITDLRSLDKSDISGKLYDLLFSQIRFVDLHTLYESLFDHISLSSIGEVWFLQHASNEPKRLYDIVKRAMDIALAVMLIPVSLVVYPFVWLAVKLDDGGPLFIFQKRVGQGGKMIRLVKFRTMLYNDDGKWKENHDNRVTRIGRFLRKTRIDELPQLVNVLHGDISLIGPRPEFPDHVSYYNEQIPYYHARHLIKPGLSGWAQIYGEHPHHGTDVEKTRNKLSYDLYYVKNRSIFVDIKIALKTIRTLVSRSGT